MNRTEDDFGRGLVRSCIGVVSRRIEVWADFDKLQVSIEPLGGKSVHGMFAARGVA